MEMLMRSQNLCIQLEVQLLGKDWNKCWERHHMIWNLDCHLDGKLFAFRSHDKLPERALQQLSKLHHCSNVSGLDVVLEVFDLLLKLRDRNLLVFDHEIDLELFDAETNRHELRTTPDKAVFLQPADSILESLQVGLVV
jgi:hypothetical protein